MDIEANVKTRSTASLSLCWSGASRSAEPLEIGVVDDEYGVAVIHALPARQKLLKGWRTS